MTQNQRGGNDVLDLIKSGMLENVPEKCDFSSQVGDRDNHSVDFIAEPTQGVVRAKEAADFGLVLGCTKVSDGLSFVGADFMSVS